MTLEMMLKERHDDGRDEGMAAGTIETARNMLKNGLSADLITKCTGISTQQISELL